MRRARPAAPAAWLAPLFAALTAAVPSYCQQATLTVRTGGGVMYGMVREYLYWGSHVASELDWSLKPLTYFETELALETGSGLTASVTAMSGIPMVTGGMTDSDWADVSNPTQKTSFSSHDCYTERALMIDSRVGWKAPSDVGVTLEPFLYFGLMMLEMSARGGHILIDPVVQPDTKVYGTVIVYEQLYLIPGAGLKAEVELARGLDLGVSCVFSPYVWCKAVDNHSYKRVEYTDTMDRALMVEPEVSLDVALSERLTLSFAVAYRYIWGLIGDEKVQDTGLDGVPNPAPPPPPPPPMPGTTSKYEDQGGASFEALRATLSVAIRL